MASPCSITPVGKRRDGGTRYWCVQHKADATAKYGRPAQQCRNPSWTPPTESETFLLDLAKYQGGVAVWGAVPPVYDTTTLPIDRGVHIHARHSQDVPKAIDATYQNVKVVGDGGSFVISELEAIYFAASSVFGYETRYVECSYCGYAHLDKDWFSVHPHRRHLCAGCGRHFSDTVISVGNPLAALRTMCPSSSVRIPAVEKLKIRQADYPGGIQIWASNSAIIWTGHRPEMDGVHVHAYAADSNIPSIDETFASVVVDGLPLDAVEVRLLMVQNVLPHISGRVVCLQCSHCGRPHLDRGDAAYTPMEKHVCTYCQREFSGRRRLRKLISNPLAGQLERLAAHAPRRPQQHDLKLLPETI